MSDESEREGRLALLRPMLTISPQGGRGLAMLAKAITLAGAPVDPVDGAEDVSGNLISYCIRDAIDCWFPKLDDPKIREVCQRLIIRWRRASAQPDQDAVASLREGVEELAYAVDAATAGFLPRVSLFLGILHPGIAAGLSIPAMTTLRDLNKAANAGLHGSTTHDEAVVLLDLLLARLVDLVAPLAVTVQQYQALIDAGDFRGLADLLAGNSDPRIRVYLFDRLRDPLLAQELDVLELLPSTTSWLAYGYLRHLAEDQPAAFTQFVNRIPTQLLTNQVAAQLLICASLAGAAAATEVDGLSKLAGASGQVELVARWLRSYVEDVPEATWWRILTRLTGLLDISDVATAPHGVAEVLEEAVTRLPDANRVARSRFSAAVSTALARLDADTPYSIRMHLDNRHHRAFFASDLIIDTAVRVVAIASALGEQVDLVRLKDDSREALERAGVCQSIAIAPPERSGRIAVKAFESVLERIMGDGWPDPDEHHALAAIFPLAGPDAASRVAAALGEPPPNVQLHDDIDNAADVRADWFRVGQWAAHLPEQARPPSWADALRESSEHGVNFGPIPPSSYLAEPRAHDSLIGDLDIASTTVPEFVERVNAAVALVEIDDPRFAMTISETVTAHTAEHRDAWAEDHRSIGQIHDLWVRRMVISALRSEANLDPRLRWQQLQELWSALIAEAAEVEAAATAQAKQALSQLATEILEHLRHRVAERSRSAADIDWWSSRVLPSILPALAWIGDAEPDIGLPALFSIRGEAVRLLVALSSPIDEDTQRDTALGRALDLLAATAASDVEFARCIGHWAKWLIHRAPEWWQRNSDRLVGTGSQREVRDALLLGNFGSGSFAFAVLGTDIELLNSFARTQSRDAAYPALTAVLFDVVPIGAIEQTTWSVVFRDALSAGNALRYLFPDESLDDEDAVRRLGMLRLIAADQSRAAAIWRSIDVLANSPDVSDDAFFAFAAELAAANRGLPMSADHLADRFIRSLANPAAVQVLDAMCSGNLGGDRAMAQYELTAVNEWFQHEATSLPTELRTRVRQALFEIGFVGNAS